MAQTFNLKLARDVSWNAELHWVDATETDQGAVGDGASVKDIVDSVGTSKKATLVFSHSGSGNTTSYSFGSDETIPDNFDILVEIGAVVAIATGVTVTCNATVAAGPFKWLSLTGTGKWAFGDDSVEQVFAEWWGAEGDGSTNDASAIQAALDSMDNAIVKLLSASYYTGTTSINIYGTGKHLIGSGIDATFLMMDVSSSAHIILGSSSVTAQACSIRDLTTYRTAGTVDTDDHGIYAQNFLHCFVQNVKVRRHYNAFVIKSETGYSNASFGLKILDCHLEEIDNVVFYLEDEVSGIVIDGNTIGNAGKGGANTLTALYFLYTDGTPDSVVLVNNIAMYSADTAEIGNRSDFTNLLVKNNIGIPSDIYATKTQNFAEIAASSYGAVSWNDITGVALGDMVFVALEVDMQNLIVDARVIAANTVEVTVYNNTAGAIDLASTTVNIRAIKAEV